MCYYFNNREVSHFLQDFSSIFLLENVRFYIGYGYGRDDMCGMLAEAHINKFHKIKKVENEGIPEIDEQLYFETYDSLKIAKKKVLALLEEEQISQGLVVDKETDKIVWLTREK